MPLEEFGLGKLCERFEMRPEFRSVKGGPCPIHFITNAKTSVLTLL